MLTWDLGMQGFRNAQLGLGNAQMEFGNVGIWECSAGIWGCSPGCPHALQEQRSSLGAAEGRAAGQGWTSRASPGPSQPAPDAASRGLQASLHTN